MIKAVTGFGKSPVMWDVRNGTIFAASAGIVVDKNGGFPNLFTTYIIKTVTAFGKPPVMWEVRNGTRFAASAGIVVDKNGENHWVVIVKGTFDMHSDGSLTPAEEQVEPTLAPEYRGDPATTSLLYEQDLWGPKPLTDVYLNATAYAPGGKPATDVVVGLRSPAGSKELLVQGDRVWTGIRALSPSRPRSFLEMPIIYERAYGGYDHEDENVAHHRMSQSNPVGTGVFASAKRRLGKMLPNIEHRHRGKPEDPAGFGAVCGHWHPRTKYQGTYDAKWLKTRRPLLPEDYDPRALQCAPEDQQISPHLGGGERFGLTNMNPRVPNLVFDLPRHSFWFVTQVGLKKFNHRATINTMIIEPSHPRVIVVWHSMLSCHHAVDDIDYTVIGEKKRV